jgi:thymidylate kinase
MKECIVHIEGCDKVGKSTIQKLLVNDSNGKILVIVRSFISQIVYSRLYNRNIDEKFFINKMKIAQNNGEIFIFLDADTNEIKKRFIQHNEKDLPIYMIDTHRNAFYKLLEELRLNGIIIYDINTAENDPRCSTAKIIKIIENIQR